jgi:hypothetical protein
MNYFAHALPFLDKPYFAAGTAVPDWLSVVDRQVRVRSKHAEPLLASADPRVAAVAGGILQHLCDDRRFHDTRAFAETSLQLTAAARNILGGDPGFRPSLLGHLLVEVLLDASLVNRLPQQVDAYYRALESADAQLVQRAVNEMAPRPTERLAAMMAAFCRERILLDYREDGRLLLRLNQVMRRLKFAALPDGFAALLPDARRLIEERQEELLQGIPA